MTGCAASDGYGWIVLVYRIGIIAVHENVRGFFIAKIKRKENNSLVTGRNQLQKICGLFFMNGRQNMINLEEYKFKIRCYANGELAIQCGSRDSDEMEYLTADLEEICEDYAAFIDTKSSASVIIPALVKEGYGILSGRHLPGESKKATEFRYLEFLFKEEKLRDMDQKGYTMYDTMRKEMCKVVIQCRCCQKEYEIEMKTNQHLLYQDYLYRGRYHIQDIFPDKEAPVRELLSRNRMCGECWTRMFGEPGEEEKV